MTQVLSRDPSSVPSSQQESIFDYRIANNRWDSLTSFRLVYDTYLQRGLIKPNHFQLRVTPYHLLPTTQTFLAVQNGKLICSVTLIGDGQLGLPMETIYPEQVAVARAKRLYVGEVSCLACKQLDFRTFLPIFVQLTRLMAQHARMHGMNQFLIAIHPKHAKFYQRFMGFEQIGSLRHYPSVQDAPAVACCLDFDRIDRERPNSWDQFFGNPLPPSNLIALPMSVEEIDYFRPAAELAESRLLVTA